MKRFTWQTKIMHGMAAVALAAGMVACSPTATSEAGEETGAEAPAAAGLNRGGQTPGTHIGPVHRGPHRRV